MEYIVLNNINKKLSKALSTPTSYIFFVDKEIIWQLALIISPQQIIKFNLLLI